MFHAFVTHERVPNFRRGDIVVIDNLSAHTNATVRQLIHNAGCEVLFTPPHSPEFNPIEEALAKLKDIIQRQETRARASFDAALSHAIDPVRPTDIAGWMTLAGYAINLTFSS